MSRVTRTNPGKSRPAGKGRSTKGQSGKGQSGKGQSAKGRTNKARSGKLDASETVPTEARSSKTAQAKASSSKTAPAKSGSGKTAGRDRQLPQKGLLAGRLAGKSVSPRATAALGHLKVLFAFLVWMALVRQQASVIVNWQQYYAQALVATAALALGSVMVVYLYPPRTARWRTLAWTFVASSFGGALVYAALGGRAGLLGALLSGTLVLWARAEEHGRRAVRRLRARRP